MLNRIILTVICIISLGWIGYIGYGIYFQSDRLNPELVFNQEDGDLLIINRTDEFPGLKTDFKIPDQIAALVEQFVAIPRNERIFISEKRPLILIESPNNWNTNTVKLYFERKGITFQQRDKSFSIGEFKVYFKYHFLLIANSDFEKNDKPIEFPAWDKKASAVIFHQFNENGSYLTEIYKHDDGEVVYQISNTKDMGESKVDDKTLFASNLPSSLENYHFYETHFAISSGVLSPSSLMTQWLDNGYVTFDYNGTFVIMTDAKIGEDPLNSINEKLAPDSSAFEENSLIPNLKLLDNFPSNTQKGFYFSRVGDKGIFSQSLDVNKKIVADFELGNTLLLDENKSKTIFGNLPYKVSERKVTATEKFAVTAFKNTIIKYFIDLNEQTKIDETPKTNTSKPLVLPLEGKILYVLGKGNQQYVLTSANKFYALNNGKLTWQQPIDGAIIGQPKIVDYEGNGKVYLLLNSSNKIYLFNEAGVNILDGKMTFNNGIQNEVNLYRWRNKSYLVFENRSNRVEHRQIDGKFAKTIQITAGNATALINVFLQNNRVVGVLRGNNSTQTIDLSKDRALKKYPVIGKQILAVKNGGNVNYFGFVNGKFVSFDYTSGNRKDIENLPDFSNLKEIEINNQSYVTFVSYGKLHIYDATGAMVKSINLPNGDIQDYDICLVNGAIYTGFVDGLQNKIIITDANGKIVANGLEGKNNVFLSFSRNGLNVLTEGNGYAVQYYDVLKKSTN